MHKRISKPAIACLLIAIASSAVLRGQVDPSPRINGAYKVTARGAYEGSGNAAVGAKAVTLTLHLKNVETGEAGTLVAPNMEMSEGRFKGTGSLGAVTVAISGRVDPADGGVVKRARITATFAMSNGLHGRFFGERNGG